MTLTPKTYFTSDWHLGHGDSIRGIITFERHQFTTIQEHDDYILNLAKSWANKWSSGSTLWYLGDFGNPQYLWIFNYFRERGHEVNFLFGNHDNAYNFFELDQYVDNIYYYPIYLSQRLVVSHFPVAVYEDSCNICGHLHGSKLADKNHVIASIHVANYQPISMKQLDGVFSQLPKYNRRFLYEPFAADYVFTQPKEDVITDKSGRIDLSASRLLQKLNTEKRQERGDSYQPYCGGLN